MGRTLRTGTLALLLWALLSPPAGATEYVRPDGTPAPEAAFLHGQGAPGRVTVVSGACPHSGWGACYYAETRTIYLLPPRYSNARYMGHEAGHDWSAQHPEVRRGFQKIMGDSRRWDAGEEPLEERFATAWGLCARGVRVGGGPWSWYDYGYSPTKRQHRRVCALVDRLST